MLGITHAGDRVRRAVDVNSPGQATEGNIKPERVWVARGPPDKTRTPVRRSAFKHERSYGASERVIVSGLCTHYAEEI